jgi:hypothetical protein
MYTHTLLAMAVGLGVSRGCRAGQGSRSCKQQPFLQAADVQTTAALHYETQAIWPQVAAVAAAAVSADSRKGFPQHCAHRFRKDAGFIAMAAAVRQTQTPAAIRQSY